MVEATLLAVKERDAKLSVETFLKVSLQSHKGEWTPLGSTFFILDKKGQTQG